MNTEITSGQDGKPTLPQPILAMIFNELMDHANLPREQWKQTFQGVIYADTEEAARQSACLIKSTLEWFVGHGKTWCVEHKDHPESPWAVHYQTNGYYQTIGA